MADTEAINLDNEVSGGEEPTEDTTADTTPSKFEDILTTMD